MTTGKINQVTCPRGLVIRGETEKGGEQRSPTPSGTRGKCRTSGARKKLSPPSTAELEVCLRTPTTLPVRQNIKVNNGPKTRLKTHSRGEQSPSRHQNSRPHEKDPCNRSATPPYTAGEPRKSWMDRPEKLKLADPRCSAT